METVSSMSNMAAVRGGGGSREAVNNRINIFGGAREAVNNTSNSIG